MDMDMDTAAGSDNHRGGSNLGGGGRGGGAVGGEVDGGNKWNNPAGGPSGQWRTREKLFRPQGSMTARAEAVRVVEHTSG